MTQRIAVLLVTVCLALAARAQTTTFTYQGSLTQNGATVTGAQDFEFRLFNAASGGVQIGSVLTLGDVGVTNGLFTVALDFGAAFDGADRFLDISVRPGASTGSHTALTPRQTITSTPYAMKALEATAVPTGTITSAMLADAAVTASKIAPGAVSQLGASDGSPDNAVQVNTNGLVGIGTTAPAAGLHITGGSAIIAPQLFFQLQDESGGYTNLNGAQSVAVAGNLMAVAGRQDGGVTLLNIINPTFPATLAQFRDGDGIFTNLGGASGVSMSSNLLVVAAITDNAVTLISVTNPSSPVKLAELRDGVGGWDNLNGAYVVAVSGNLLAIGAFIDGAVTLADISNPSAPVLRSTIKDGQFGFTNLAGVQSIALSGNLLAIGAYNDSSVTLVDVSNPTNPIKLAEMRDGVGGFDNLGRVGDVALSGNLLAIAAVSDNTVTLVNVANPSSPVKLAELRHGINGLNALFGARGVAFSGNLLAVAAEHIDAVTVFDISDPSNPRVQAVVRDGTAGFNLLDTAMELTFAGTNLAVTALTDDAITLIGIPAAAAGLISEGRVGIGTTLPLAPLHVVGNVLVEDADFFEINASRVTLGLDAVASGAASVAMGRGNASGSFSTAMGSSTRASGAYSTAMGDSSFASGFSSTAMGTGTAANGRYSTAIGYFSAAAGDHSFAAGHQAYADHPGTFVWADAPLPGGPVFSSTGSNQFLIRAVGGVGINTNDPNGAALNVNGTVVARAIEGSGPAPLEFKVNGLRALRLEPNVVAPNVIGGFSGNIVSNGFWGATIGGGGFAIGVDSLANKVGDSIATIGGGANNTSSGYAATVSGGGDNISSGRFATVAGGAGNTSSVFYATVGGGERNASSERAATVGGGSRNLSSGQEATVAGGFINKATANFSTVGGGQANSSSGFGATVPGGLANTAGGQYSFAAGKRAKALHEGTFVWADSQNADFASTASNQFNIRAQGGVRLSDDTSGLSFGNTTRQMLDLWGSLYGIGVQGNTMYFRSARHYAWYRDGVHNDGELNPGGGTELMRLGDQGNLHLSGALSELSLANRDVGGFVQTPTSGERWVLYSRNEGAGGRFFIWSGSDKLAIDTSGNLFITGALNPPSDRAVKAGFAPVDAKEILEKVAALPITRWHYTNNASTPHLGPVAQDFHAAFGVGTDDKHIATVDADGVALAAIQGLNQIVEEKESRIAELERQNIELLRRFEAMERRLK